MLAPTDIVVVCNNTVNKLPNIPDDNQYGLLELKITTCDFMQLLYNTLFEEKTYAKEAAKYDNRVDRNKKAGPSIFDFASLPS